MTPNTTERNENGYMSHPDRQRQPSSWVWLALGLVIMTTAILGTVLQGDPSYLTLLVFAAPLVIYGATQQFELAALPLVLYILGSVAIASLTAAAPDPRTALLSAGIVTLTAATALFLPFLLWKVVDR